MSCPRKSMVIEQVGQFGLMKGKHAHLSSKYKNIVKMPHYSSFLSNKEMIEQMHKIIKDYERN